MQRICCLIFTLFTAATSLADTRVVYPRPESDEDVRFLDLIEILDVALQKTEAAYGPYTLEPSETIMREGRQIEELKRPNSTINVLWSSTSEEKEAQLIPIRIPLRKGLLGYRISLIHQSKQSEIDQIHSLEDLQASLIGQGLGWGDVDVYEANGITVSLSGYENLFKMLNANRFDLFPRGLNEVFAEYQLRNAANPNIKIEDKLLIYYPWPYYFFTNKQNTALAERIQQGLRQMIDDGSFDYIFMKHNGNALAEANIKARRVIRLVNPLLPAATPLDDRSLWYDPMR